MTISWVTNAGSLGTIYERETQSIILEATSDTGPVKFSLIAGQLPRGLYLSNNIIKGSPVEVRQLTTNRFVIRADDGTDIEDRTFSLTIDGSDAPQWLTAEGYLPVGENDTFFVLDNAFVNFQLEAYDPDVIIGDTLEYYIPAGGGELPPGLSLTKDGRIFGYTDPIFSVEYLSGNGGYDSTAFDVIALDSGPSNLNGYDSFLFDEQNYDYNEAALPPRRLSRYYSFVVVVSDGLTEVRRSFRIYVVTDEFLRADNTIIQVDTGIFKADNTPERTPIWITESNLGQKRANNYITIYLDVYNPPTLPGSISYLFLNAETQWAWKDPVTAIPNSYEVDDLVIYNGDPYICIETHTASSAFNPDLWEAYTGFPPGMALDTITGEVAGRVPYQPKVSKSYVFKLQAISYDTNLASTEYDFKGDWSATVTYSENNIVRFNGFVWVCTESHRNKYPQDNSQYWNKGSSTSDKVFRIEIVGEVESGINWISNSDCGVVYPNQASTISVVAESLLYGGQVIYEFVSGKLPPGLQLLSTGDIVGKSQQFSNTNDKNYLGHWNPVTTYEVNDTVSVGTTRYYAIKQNTNQQPVGNARYWSEGSPGLTRFFETDGSSKSFNITWDGGQTSFDRVFRFRVRAKDTANFSELIKEFFITVSADSEVTYSNLYLKAFQAKNKRLNWFDFITDANIFRPSELYRYGDSYFGVQPELKVLMYAGIESLDAVNFVQAMSRNHYRKRLRFGDLKKVVAKNPTTQQVEYETIVVEIKDELEKDGKSIVETIELPDGTTSRVLVSTNNIRISSDIYLASERDNQRVFPNSFKNMRKRIKRLGQRDRTFLPLWMRSIQDADFVETGWVGAIVLCYAEPGKADSIMARIRASEFDFKSLDFEADRYIIDSIGGEIEDKYLAFPQRDIINKLSNPTPIFEDYGVRYGTFDSDITFDTDLTFDQG